ncbi:MAG: hypothetical protein VB877_08520 [Pirellulaceae bacterium]
MKEAATEQLNQVQQQAGDRYRAMIFYQKLCEVMAWVNLGLGGLAFLICAMAGVNQAEPGMGMVVLGYGFLALLAGVWGFFICKIVANFIKGFVDIAVNSHLQVYLLSEQRSPAE